MVRGLDFHEKNWVLIATNNEDCGEIDRPRLLRALILWYNNEILFEWK